MRKYLVFAFSTIVICNCNQNNDFVSHDKREWPYLKELQVEPDSVVWSSHDMSSNRALAVGPTDRYIQAVLFYNDSTWQDLLNKVDTSSGELATIHVDSPYFQEWFPAQVQSMFFFDGTHYVSDKPAFLLNPDHPWRTRCLTGNKFLFLTYCTN